MFVRIWRHWNPPLLLVGHFKKQFLVKLSMYSQYDSGNPREIYLFEQTDTYTFIYTGIYGYSY